MILFLTILKWVLLVLGIAGIFISIIYIIEEPVSGVIVLFVTVALFTGFYFIGKKLDSNPNVQEKQRIVNEQKGRGSYTNIEIRQEKSRLKAERKELQKAEKLARIENNKIQEQQKKEDKLAQAENEKSIKLQEKQNQLDKKNLAKAQAMDLANLVSLASIKIKDEEILVQTDEPAKYVVAPMSYDTSKFIAANSHDSGMFGKTVDNSTERLLILESCLTDFKTFLDRKDGVSFLDRSKIEQIELEHKFQLGDWSNDKKTAEIGKALNSNILLFFDKFGYLDNNYYFEAKFVDVNTMKTSSFNMIYKKPKGKIVTPQNAKYIFFDDFTPISTKKNPFATELNLKIVDSIRTVQNSKLTNVSPLGNITKISASDFDTKAPSVYFADVKSMNFDGFDTVEFVFDDRTETYKYSFDPIEIKLLRRENMFLTDGKIGTLKIETNTGYIKMDVYTENQKEFFINYGSANIINKKFFVVKLGTATVNYYIQLLKQ